MAFPPANRYRAPKMSTPADFPLPSSEFNVKSLLAWLANPPTEKGANQTKALHEQLLLLRSTAMPIGQRLKLLQLFFIHTQEILGHIRATLSERKLPLSRRRQQQLRPMLIILEALTQDYLNTLAELFDPEARMPPNHPGEQLWHAMRLLTWSINTSHLGGSAPQIGSWQQLHRTYANAVQLAVSEYAGEHRISISRLYKETLLAGTAQPASFEPHEFLFIERYLERMALDIRFSPLLSEATSGTFWLDPSRDLPPAALTRRPPAPETDVLYFSFSSIADAIGQQIKKLEQGYSADSLLIPDFPDKHACTTILARLAQMWGQPAKRRYPRRRHNYRASLCSTLPGLHLLLGQQASANDASEWMVTNESPDGYALMHLKGPTGTLHVGDVVALQPSEEHPEASDNWQICLVRWALSDNPEHIEIGLQLLTTQAHRAQVTHLHGPERQLHAALYLPGLPQVGNSSALVLPAGAFQLSDAPLLVLIEKENLEIKEIKLAALEEQTSRIEVFSLHVHESK